MLQLICTRGMSYALCVCLVIYIYIQTRSLYYSYMWGSLRLTPIRSCMITDDRCIYISGKHFCYAIRMEEFILWGM